MNETLKTLMERRSIRSYKSEIPHLTGPSNDPPPPGMSL